MRCNILAMKRYADEIFPDNSIAARTRPAVQSIRRLPLRMVSAMYLLIWIEKIDGSNP